MSSASVDTVRFLQCRQLSAGECRCGQLSVELDGGTLVCGVSTGVASLTMAEEKYLKLEINTKLMPKEGAPVKLVIELPPAK